MNTKEIFNKMKEENKIQEELLKQKIMEGNENLKKKLEKIKKDMEKISIYSNVNYETIKNKPVEDVNKMMKYDRKGQGYLRGIEEENKYMKDIRHLDDEDQVNDVDEEDERNRESKTQFMYNSNEFTLNNQDKYSQKNKNFNADQSQSQSKGFYKSKDKFNDPANQYNQSGQFSQTSSKARQEEDQSQIKNKLNDTYKSSGSNKDKFFNSNMTNKSNDDKSPIVFIENKNIANMTQSKSNELSSSNKTNKSKSNSSKSKKANSNIGSTVKSKKSLEDKAASSGKSDQAEQRIIENPQGDIEDRHYEMRKIDHHEHSQNNPYDQYQEIDSDKDNPEEFEQPILKNPLHGKHMKNKEESPSNHNSNSQYQYHHGRPLELNQDQNPSISNNNSNINDNYTKSSRSANFQGQPNYQSKSNTGNDFYRNYDNNNQTNNFNSNNSQMQTGQGFRQEDDDISTNKNNTGLLNNNYNDDSQYESFNNPQKKVFQNTNKSSQSGNQFNKQNNDYSNDSYLNDSKRDIMNNRSEIRSNQDYYGKEGLTQIKPKNAAKQHKANANGDQVVAFGGIVRNSVKDENKKAQMEVKDARNKVIKLKKEIERLEKIKSDQIKRGTYNNSTCGQSTDKNQSKSQAKRNNGSQLQKKKPKITFGADEYEDYKIYEKNIMDQIAKEEIYDEVGEAKDVLGEFVDKVIERSLYLYKNRNCHYCSQLLSKGQSTHKCPKFHHKLQ